jgi:hypothetical protein
MVAIGAIPPDALQGFTVLGGTGAGWHHLRRHRRSAGHHGRKHAWHADHGTSRRVDRQNPAQSRDIKGQDMKGQDMKGQDMAKRVLEVAGAGGHALLST